MEHTSGATEPRRPTMAKDFACDLKVTEPLQWLKAGIKDTFTAPVSSLSYGFAVFLVSILFVLALFHFGFSYILFPVVAGFMVLGPLVAIGLYGKSRSLSNGVRTVSTFEMLSVKARSPKQLLLISIVLMFVMTLWLRAAVMLYALFFGLEPVGSFEETIETLFFSNKGQMLLLIGSVIGGGLAAFAFTLSAFSIPMLVNEKRDTMTAMALSVVISWMNKPVVFVWGVIVLTGFLISVLTAFVGLIVIFPILGHATWHAYKAMRSKEALAEAERES